MSEELKSVYVSWMDRHFRQSKGEWKRRLQQHGHGEQMFISQVWWPAFRKLDGLIPEFEVRDFKDGRRYLDFAYFTNGMHICIEIDAYGTHLRDIDRWKYADNLMRQNHLIIDDWYVIRFSYDDIKDSPRRCQQLLQQLFGSISVASDDRQEALSHIERAIVKHANLMLEPIRTKETSEFLGLGREATLRYIRMLVDKNVLVPIRPGAKHVRGYKLNASTRKIH